MLSNNLLISLVQLFETKQKQLYIAALSITQDRASAEDAVLDAMLAVSELKQAPDDLLAYLYRTVRNKALHSSKQSARLTSDSACSNFIASNSYAAEEQVFVSQILEQLKTLESNQQQVLIMKLFGDLTFDEIAEITSSNPNTVASWYRRGLQKLKESIHEPAL